jgi:hypothetical protein
MLSEIVLLIFIRVNVKCNDNDIFSNKLKKPIYRTVNGHRAQSHGIGIRMLRLHVICYYCFVPCFSHRVKRINIAMLSVDASRLQ